MLKIACRDKRFSTSKEIVDQDEAEMESDCHKFANLTTFARDDCHIDVFGAGYVGTLVTPCVDISSMSAHLLISTTQHKFQSD